MVSGSNTDEVQQHLRTNYPDESDFPGDWLRLSSKDKYQG